MDRIFEKFRQFCTSYVFEGFFIEENGVILEGTGNLYLKKNKEFRERETSFFKRISKGYFGGPQILKKWFRGSQILKSYFGGL